MYAALVAAIIVVSLIREGAHSDLVSGGAILVLTTVGFLLALCSLASVVDTPLPTANNE